MISYTKMWKKDAFKSLPLTVALINRINLNWMIESSEGGERIAFLVLGTVWLRIGFAFKVWIWQGYEPTTNLEHASAGGEQIA
jgi:hypothetical protein